MQSKITGHRRLKGACMNFFVLRGLSSYWFTEQEDSVRASANIWIAYSLYKKNATVMFLDFL